MDKRLRSPYRILLTRLNPSLDLVLEIFLSQSALESNPQKTWRHHHEQARTTQKNDNRCCRYRGH